MFDISGAPRRIGRCVLVAIGLVPATGCAASTDVGADETLGSQQQALSTRVVGVTFRTVLGQHFIGAENSGGGAVIASATAADAWEKFALLDINGGSLESGDLVYLRAGNGQYWQASNGGGGAVNAASFTTSDWERFRLVRESGAGVVRSGDVVGLQTMTSGRWVLAENGGGSAVRAYGASLGPWERFTIGLGATDDAATRVSGVTFRSVARGQYLSALGNGGGAVTATATRPDEWETFSVLDTNGGELESGDEIQVLTGNGRFFQAESGGGGAVNASALEPRAWETFRIVRSGGQGPIRTGDVVGLQTIIGGQMVSAAGGGGAGVFANRTTFDDWERFSISLGGTYWVHGPEASGYRLVWSDEFNGPGIDESKWGYEVQAPGWVNNELQSYTDHRWQNARVEDGHLIIEARRDGFQGYDYSSARLKTHTRASWTYGRVEARIQVPDGWGTWPAFWMMPDDMRRGWPACGEIDIMEHVGFDANVVHATTHTQAYNWRSSSQRTSHTLVPGATTGFHVYALEWSPESIVMSVDGVPYFTSPNDHTGDDAWPFDKRFHIILNLAVGGDWGGARGVDHSTWPRQMRVDYVRVYQR